MCGIWNLSKTGLKCKRINSLLEVEPESAAAERSNYKRVLDKSGKTEKKLRPRKRTTLSNYISLMFQNNIPQADVNRIIDIFFANKLISEANNGITYEF